MGKSIADMNIGMERVLILTESLFFALGRKIADYAKIIKRMSLIVIECLVGGEKELILELTTKRERGGFL